MPKSNHRSVFGNGVTYNPLITKILDSLNKFNRIFDKKSNSNILHGYSSCSTLEGEPKSMISKGGEMFPCCGLLRHFVEKISHLGVNVPHNDMEICSLAPCDSAEQNNPVNCFARGGLGRGGKCQPETLTRICNVHSGSRTNSALSQIERDKDEKNLVPACLKALVPIKKKVAFTLTEVLLAVLIVGIIAALVLPAVVTKYQDKAFESAFNREVHSLQDSIDSLAAVENQQSFYETTLAKTPETYMKKYLRVSKYCGTSGKDCFGKFYSEYSDHEKKTYTPSYDGNCAILKNGTSVCLNVNGGSIDMLIDVNGPKGPNVFGRDLRTYTHSVKGKTGYDMSSNGIISLNQTPIEDDDSDPCKGKTCGCGDLPDCDPCVGKTCGCGSLPPCGGTCSSGDTSLTCCKKRTITGESDPCCKWSYYDNNTTCHPKHDYIVTLDYYATLTGAVWHTYITRVTISPNSIPSSDLSKLDVVIKYWIPRMAEDEQYNCQRGSCAINAHIYEMPASYLSSIQSGSCRGYHILGVERGTAMFNSAHRIYWKQSGSTVYKIGNNVYTLKEVAGTYAKGYCN